MVAQPRSRTDAARRLALRLGVEFHPDLIELVPPAGWDEVLTRAELAEALRARDEHVDRRIRAIRDALAVAHQDDARRHARRTLAVAGAVLAAVALARACHGRTTVSGRARDHGGSSAGQREALHRRRVG
jgi:hypothetical protein